MTDRFFSSEEFNDCFDTYIENALSLYDTLVNNGLKEFSLRSFDIYFISNEKEKLESLAEFLKVNYNYQISEIENHNEHWEFNAETIEFPINNETIQYWLIDLYVKGFDFDCKIDGYGSLEPDEVIFPNLNNELEDEYFNKALEYFDNGNFGSAIINWTTVLKINPNDPNSYYSKAIAKQELFIWKDALKDYDKSIELAPDFVSAIINRATLKDELGEFDDAIDDYNRAIELDNKNGMAFFNRGNSKFNKGDKSGACQDWHIAKSLGAEYAQERIDIECC